MLRSPSTFHESSFILGADPPDNIGHRWNEVVRRGHHRRAEIRGSRQAEDTNLKAAEKIAWLYVGKLHQTTEKYFVKFLRDNEITGEIACDQLDTKGINKAFRVGIGYDHLAQANSSEFWPEGLLVRQYIFRASRNTSVLLRTKIEERKCPREGFVPVTLVCQTVADQLHSNCSSWLKLRRIVGPTQSLIQWVPGALSPGVKRQGREADNSPPYSDEVKNGGAISPLCHTSSWHSA
jgi:hypothetical protein